MCVQIDIHVNITLITVRVDAIRTLMKTHCLPNVSQICQSFHNFCNLIM